MLTGLRGVGKTVLLNQVRRMAQEVGCWRTFGLPIARDSTGGPLDSYKRQRTSARSLLAGNWLQVSRCGRNGIKRQILITEKLSSLVNG